MITEAEANVRGLEMVSRKLKYRTDRRYGIEILQSLKDKGVEAEMVVLDEKSKVSPDGQVWAVFRDSDYLLRQI